MAYRYKPNKYTIYDDTLTFEENYQNEAVITKKKLDRLEEQVKLSSADWAIGKVKYVDKTEDADFSIDFNELEGTYRLNMSMPLRGKSAYQSWLDLGNEGTEEDFIASLKGDTFQHRMFLNKLVLEDIHGNTSNFNNIYEYFEDEVRIFVNQLVDEITDEAMPEFNARFYGPSNAASAQIVYSTDLSNSSYSIATVSKDEDDCVYIARRIEPGEVDDEDKWVYYGNTTDKNKFYWKVLWYDNDGKMIGADRFKILFVNKVAGLFSENDEDTAAALRKEFTTLVNDAVVDLRAELNEKINEVNEMLAILDDRTCLKVVE